MHDLFGLCPKLSPAGKAAGSFLLDVGRGPGYYAKGEFDALCPMYYSLNY